MDCSEEISKKIKKKALEIGFDICGISDAFVPLDAQEKYTSWINLKFHAGLTYMERNCDKRFAPDLIVENAKSVISVAKNYYPEIKQPDNLPQVSKYAYGNDYHFLMWEKLEELYEFINSMFPGVSGKIYCDTGPVLERAFAQKAGVGWIGKNTCLITKSHGSFVFLGEIIVDTYLYSDVPHKNHCGNCTMCIDACPTNAITNDGFIDSSKCISYHTIESKDEIPQDLRDKFKGYIFGCDICQDACPWNKKTTPSNEKYFEPLPFIQNAKSSDYLNLDEGKFKEIFKKSPLYRTKLKGIKRNVSLVVNAVT